jgi:dienelactone hydrolase
MSTTSHRPTVRDSVVRESARFDSGGTACDAWIYRPGLAVPDRPVIVMAHGMGAVKGMRLDAYAERFTAAGYVCLVFDYRFFGDSEGHPRQRLSVRDQIEDWTAAIAYARALPGIDPARVVVWGTSFAGGHVLTMAARDTRLAAAIAQCPFTDGLASSLAADPITAAKVTASAVRDLARAWSGRDPLYLPLSAAPGTTAFMNAPDALPGMEALTAGVERYENRMTARSAFEVLRYAPGRSAKGIECPLFVALCEHETLAPVRPAQRQVARATRAEIRMYPIGHYDIYLGRNFERAVADYLRFLEHHVPV